MILSAQSIRRACVGPLFDDGTMARLGRPPMIEPFCERSVVSGMSYGLSCCGYDVRIAQDVTLWPVTLGNLVINAIAWVVPGLVRRRSFFTLASTIERFAIPNDAAGFVAAKSSLARNGISVFEMTVLEPGWHGFLTLEISNRGEKMMHLSCGDPVAQIVFTPLDETTSQPYVGKYSDQPPRPVPAISEGDR